MEKKTLFICIPCGKNADFGFFKSFAQSIGEIMHSWNTAIITESSPYVVESRNQISRKVLEFDKKSQLKVDYVLWIDSDMVFSPEHLKKLIGRLEEGNDIVSALYYNLFNGKEKPLAMKRAGERYELIERQKLGKGLTEVDAVGFGFIAIKFDVFRRLEGKYGNRIFDIRYLKGGSIIGEDQVFCERAKEAGYKIMLDPTILVKHIKGTIPSKQA